MTTKVIAIGWLVLFTAACGGSASGDAGPVDASTHDAPTGDASLTDAPAIDAPAQDGGTGDGGTGDGGATSALITAAAGGRVTSPDGIFTLVVPPHAVTADTTFSISIVPHSAWPAEVVAAPPVAELYDIQPDGYAFLVPAYGVHAFATTPPSLRSAAGDPYFTTHAMRAADGTVTYAARTRTVATAAGGTFIVGTLPHTSEHWATVGIVTVSAAPYQLVGSVVDGPAAPGTHDVGSSWTPTSLELTASDATADIHDWRVGSLATYSLSAIPSPIPLIPDFHGTPFVEAGATVGGMDVLEERLDGPSLGAVTLTPLVAFPAPTPLPGWTCAHVGDADTYVTATVSDRFSDINELDIELGTATCAAPATRTLATISGGEHADVFCLTDGTECGPGLRTYPGASLPSGAYAVVAGTGGVDVVHLADGHRYTDPFPVFSNYHGATMTEQASGLEIEAYGPSGVDDVGWLGSYGGDGLSALGNVTQSIYYDTTGDGVDDVRAVSAGGGVRIDGARSIGLFGTTAFPGATSPQVVSAALVGDRSSVIANLVSGEIYYGPTAGPLANVGTCGTDLRLMNCADGTTTVCAAADYGGSAVCMIEVDATGARVTTTATVGASPVEPSVMVDGTTVLVAVAGSTDGLVHVMRYDPATDSLVDALPPWTLTGCTTANHVTFVNRHELLVTCFGSSGMLVIPLVIP